MQRAKLCEQVLELWGHRCADCGAWGVEIHHIHGWLNGWKLENLIPLCPDCHRHKNKGAGAHTRAARERHERMVEEKLSEDQHR
ncbi:MAG: HNH endonuclease [Chloroflexi bacterium]|nr:HNH endonuclease [Chloroflexota bacterium]